MRLVEFFQNKEPNNSEERFSKNQLFLPQVETDRDLDNKIDILNNFNLEKMAKSKTNLSNIKQKELSK